MTISLSERLLSLAQAAREHPGRPHISCLHRWRTKGVRGVVLETLMLGGRRYTSSEALQRFADRVTAAADRKRVDESAPAAEPARTRRQRQAEIAQAERELDRAGV